MKEKAEGDNDSEWDSVEEDYPHIQLDDLKSLQDQLAGMKIKGGESDEDEDEKIEEKKQWAYLFSY